MMRWTVQELFSELRRDSTRRVLFIEGKRDQQFWHFLVPTNERVDTTIYTIGRVECADVEGGERGRLLWFAGIVADSEFSHRIAFFADEDAAGILGQAVPDNVTLTDGRDFESYGCNEDCFDHINSVSFQNPPGAGKQLLDQIGEKIRPVGLLRIASARKGYRLPFRKTLNEATFNRCVKLRGDAVVVDLDKAYNILLTNGRRRTPILLHGLAACDLHEIVADEEKTLKDMPHSKIIHGKDLVAALAVAFAVEWQEMERHFFAAVIYHLDLVRQSPNLARVESWVRSQASIHATGQLAAQA